MGDKSPETKVHEGNRTPKRRRRSINLVLPNPSILARERKTKASGEKKKTGTKPAVSKKITAEMRVRDPKYEGEPFVMSPYGKLFCDACHHELSNKASTIKYHIKSSKHRKGK